MDGDFYYLTPKIKTIICHATDNQLECLSLSKIWHVDGTFKHAAEHYYQFYTISAWFNNDMQPCAFIQLKNKSTKCYEKALENLVLHSSHPLRPSLVHGDFVKAAQNAFRTVF